MRPLTADFLNKEAKDNTVSPTDLDGKTVPELKEMLREQDLPVSGTKAQLVERLQANSATDAVLSIEEEPKEHAGGLAEETCPGGEVRKCLLLKP